MSRQHPRSARLPRRWFLALPLTVLFACAHTQPAPRVDEAAAARTAIAAANDAYARALVRGDARAMAAVFAADGKIIPVTERGFVTGRDAIEAYQAKRLQGRRYVDVVITTVQLDVSGDLAWETGTSRVRIQQGEGAPVTLTGRYLAVWKRQPDGGWLIQADLPVTDPIE